MASALMILFLGCWLAGQSGVSGEGTDSAGIQEPNPSMMEKEEDKGNDSPETEEPDSTTMEPEGKEGTESAETKQTDPPMMGSEGKDAGSSPARGTKLTQPGATPTPAHSGGTGPGTESGSRKSTSTPPETGGTDTTPSGTTPTSPCPCGESRGSKLPSTPPKTEGTDPAGPQQPDPSMTEPEGEEGSEPAIIAGVSAAAAGLLLLLLAFLCYRRKGPAPRQSRESEPATTVYALMGEGKQLDVLPQKPDPSAEGHTYAELDGQALQAKQGGAAPAPEPPLYSTITMSQGPNGQSPQGEAEPPTDPHSVNPGGVTGETGQEASATTG